METKKTKGKGFIRFVKGLKLFFFEVLIVVIAVMFSFLLNEWRIEQGEKEVEKKILEQVLEDIKTDSAKINFNTQLIRDLIDGSLRIIELTQDSSFDDYIKRYLSARAVVNYVPFQPSKSGYFELTSQGNTGKIQDKKLLM